MATLFLPLWRQSAINGGLSVKPGLAHLGHWQTVQTQIRHRMRCLIRVCTVCSNYRKLRVKWNSLKFPFRTIFPANTKRQSTHQCCQCFDLLLLLLLLLVLLLLLFWENKTWHFMWIIWNGKLCFLWKRNKKMTATDKRGYPHNIFLISPRRF